jgi:DNA-binding NarL/FixJ family response regulator
MNILVSSEHAITRSGITNLLKRMNFSKKITEVQDLSSIHSFLNKREVDVLFLDCEVHGFNPVVHVSKIKKMYSSIYIVASCDCKNEQLIHSIHEAGANAFICRETSFEELCRLMQMVVSGEGFYCEGASKILFKLYLAKEKQKSKSTAHGFISKREQEVLRLICEEMDNNQIADRLFISSLTVRRHRQNLLAKTRVSNTAGLVVYAIRTGIYRVFESAQV